MTYEFYIHDNKIYLKSEGGNFKTLTQLTDTAQEVLRIANKATPSNENILLRYTCKIIFNVEE